MVISAHASGPAPGRDDLGEFLGTAFSAAELDRVLARLATVPADKVTGREVLLALIDSGVFAEHYGDPGIKDEYDAPRTESRDELLELLRPVLAAADTGTGASGRAHHREGHSRKGYSR